MSKKKKLLLHSCCGPCSTAVIQRLIEDFDITIFYYNPNITDKEEYEKRRDEQIKFLKMYEENTKNKVNFLEGDYITKEFFDVIVGLEGEKEGGGRCSKCFELRLAGTAKKAKELGFDLFGTTLTVSPHKNYALISKIGHEIGGNVELEFLDMDFKKKAGYQISIELSKEYDLYRQNYCGCEFSKWFLK